MGKSDSLDDINSMQHDLKVLECWSRNNEMPFNVNKCKVLHLGRKNRKHKYSLLGSYLEDTKEEKDLGVIFNESFSLGYIEYSTGPTGAGGYIRR